MDDWKDMDEGQRPEPKSYQIYNDLRDIATSIDEFKNWARFLLKDSGPTEDVYGFKELRPQITHVIDIAQQILQIPQAEAVKLPRSVLKSIFVRFENMEQLLRSMRNHYEHYRGTDVNAPSEEKERVIAEKDDLAQEFEGLYNDFHHDVLPLLNLATQQKNQAYEERIADLQAQNTKRGIEQFHNLYEVNADSHCCASRWWIVFGVALAVFALIFGLELAEELKEFSGDATKALFHFEYVLLRFFLLALFVSMIVWCFKQHKLNKHNELLNRQKQLALKTFDEFSHAAGPNEDLRHIVLSKVTSTIFDPQQMGYVEMADNRNSVETAELLAILKDIKSMNNGN